jgi:hypothetical protein
MSCRPYQKQTSLVETNKKSQKGTLHMSKARRNQTTVYLCSKLVLDWATKTELNNKSALECVQVSLKLFSDLIFQIRNYFLDLVGIMQSLQAYNTDYKLEYRELAWSKWSESQDK